MDPVTARIDAWQHAGLIDSVTADRLRADEAARLRDLDASSADEPSRPAGFAAPGPAAPTAARPGYLTISSVFGPGITIGEMFGYLGAGFLLGAWSAFVVRLAGPSADLTMIGGGALIAAVGLVVLALALGTTKPRQRRAAGVALVVAVLYVAAAAGSFIARSKFDPYVIAMIVTAAAMGAATAFRLLLPGLLTTIALVGSITSFGWAVIAFAVSLVVPRVDYGFELDSRPANPLPGILIAAVGWLVVGLVLGIVAIAEDRAAPDRAADPDGHAAARRRSTLIRAWAGLVAVWGLASAVTTSTYTNDNFDYGRVIPPWIGDAAILVLALVLVERAFRRDSGAFLFAAGIGFATALTDFNFSYLSESRDLGLLIEGGILLVVGFGAERLRRRMPGGRPPGPPATARPPSDTPIGDPLAPTTFSSSEPAAEVVDL
jgi:hypothetical protein